MVMCKLPCWILLAGCLLCGLGCGGTKPTQPATAVDATKPTDKPPAASTNTGTTSSIPKIEEDSAAAAVLTTLKGLEAGKLAEAYDFLPGSYQSDLDGLLHDFAGKMDPEIWSRLTGAARKTIAFLKSKKEFLLELDLFRNRPEAEPYRQHWDSTLTLLTSLVEDDASDLAKLKQITLRSLLPGKSSAGTLDVLGQAIGANVSRQFAGVTVTPVRTNGAEQVVAIRGPHDDKPTEFVYVKHDGKWLPKSLVERWDAGIKEDREWLARLPERIKAIKPKLLDALSQADEVLDQLQSAADKQQFEQAVGPAILQMASAWPGMVSLFRQTVAGQEEMSQLSIKINRELTESELSKLVANVLKPLRESGSNYTLLANDGRTLCRITHVSDVAKLRQSLATHFSLPIDDVPLDRDEATIQIKLTP
ncbi:MAG: hypothetical protein WCJ09_07460 [Planctomycetota bacterium]